MALAVNPEMEYVTVRLKDLDEKWILAKSRVEKVLDGENYEVLSECKGKDLVGIEYSGMMGEALKNVGEMVVERGKVNRLRVEERFWLGISSRTKMARELCILRRRMARMTTKFAKKMQ